jgi:hypothetical protein
MRALCRLLPSLQASPRQPTVCFRRPMSAPAQSLAPAPPMRIALLQLPVTSKKDENLRVAGNQRARAG